MIKVLCPVCRSSMAEIDEALICNGSEIRIKCSTCPATIVVKTTVNTEEKAKCATT